MRPKHPTNSTHSQARSPSASLVAAWILAVTVLGCDTSPTAAPNSSPSTADSSTSKDDGPKASANRTSTPVAVAPAQIPLDEPNQTQPVSMAAAIFPRDARPGETVTLVIRAKTAELWHIYAVDRPTGVSKPTTLNMRLPDGVEGDGTWDLPEPELKPSEFGDTYLYHGDVLFRTQLKITEGTPAGPLRVACEVGYQACTDAICLLPSTVEVVARVDVVQ